MTSHHRHRSAAFVAIALGVIVLASCSSTDSDAPTAGAATTLDVTVGTSTTPATSEPSTTSNVPTETEVTSIAPMSTVEEQPADTRPVDEQSRDLATAMTLQAADFPEPWTVFSEAAPFSVTPDLCFYRPEGAVTLLPNGAAQRGPTMQVGTEAGWVSSYAIAFPDEASAQEYVGVVNTDEWAECVRKGFDDRNAAEGSVGIEATIADHTTTGFGEGGQEGDLEITLANEDGVYDTIRYLTFRIGGVVGAVTLEVGAMDEATSTQFNQGHYDALVKAYDRVYALGVE